MAKNSRKIINNLDMEFEEQTELKGKDIKFLFLDAEEYFRYGSKYFVSKLSDEEKNAITDVNAAIALMLDKPAIIKRPILVSSDNRFMVGFNANDYLTFTGA